MWAPNRRACSPTGQLAACDPLAYFEPRPFRQTCPASRYPVYVHLLPEDQRIAYAELRLREAMPVSQWELGRYGRPGSGHAGGR